MCARRRRDSAAAHTSMNAASAGSVFDVGINDRLPPGQLLILGLQNVFGMTGMFVFPGLLGRSFNLTAGTDCISLWHDVSPSAA